MKVKHLIRELMKCDPEHEVETEGCDCDGDTYCVEQRSNFVYIRRHDEFISLYDENGERCDWWNDRDTPRPLPQ